MKVVLGSAVGGKLPQFRRWREEEEEEEELEEVAILTEFPSARGTAEYFSVTIRWPCCFQLLLPPCSDMTYSSIHLHV